MRARIRRRERQRKLTYITIISAVVVVAILVGYYVSTLYAQNSLIGKPITNSDYQALDHIALSSAYGPVNTTLMSAVKTSGGSLYLSGVKPIVVYIGAEYCPYCAFMRWPLTVALMRFGNFSGINYMQSSPTDIFPSTDTLSYYGSTYSSPYIVFQPFEAEGRTQGQALQSVPSNYSAVLSSNGGGYPFMDVANKFVLSGTFYYPSYLGSGSGSNWTKDIQTIGTSGSKLSSQVMSAANAITALICSVTSEKPNAVCNNASVQGYTGSVSGIAAYVSPPSASLTAGSTSKTATMWSTVQYKQMAPRTKISA